MEQVQGQLDFVGSSPVFELRVGYLYDGLSQLKNLVRLKDATQKATVYDYDFLGRMIRSEDFLVPGRETFMTYADYCTGNLTTTPRGVQREATYDERCRLRQLQTQDETHEFDYDELNRLIRVRMGSRFAHDSPPVGAEYSTSFYTHETRYTYDELDRVVEILYPNGETVSYEYNENGDVTRMVDVHGKETLYEYYHDGRLLSVTYEGQVFTYTYDAVGRLESLTYPTTPDDLVLNFSWDDDGRLLSMEYLKNSAAFQSFTYTYDDSGNRVTMEEVDPSSVTTSWEYGYDWFNRLTSVTKNSTQVESYTYDESDNRKTMTRPLVNELWEYSYDLADQLESITVTVGAGSPVLVESFTPDEDGNVLSRDKGGVVTEYQWDTMNRLRQVKVDGDVIVRSLYDGGGIRRLSKDDGGGQSKFFSSGGMSLADKRPGGPVSFIQGHQLLGAEQGGDYHFFITDGLGSVRLVVDESADAEGAFDQDVWGNPDSGVTPPGAELRAHSFIGALGVRNDFDLSGLLYMRQRYYDPTLGRFLNQDPIGFAGGSNSFGYAAQNPVNAVDPGGLKPTKTTVLNHVDSDFIKFLLGKPLPSYGPDSIEVSNMKNSPIVNSARELYAKKNAGKSKCKGLVGAERVGEFGIVDFLDATADLNSTRHYLGSFWVDMTPAAGNQVHMKLTDSKNSWSLFFHQIPESKQGYCGGFLRTQHQTYEWTENRPADDYEAPSTAGGNLLVDLGYWLGLDLRPSPFGGSGL